VEVLRLPNGREVDQLNAAETSLMYRNIFTDRCYLKHGVELRPGGTVFDVGANVGIASLFFHWDCAGQRVYAFEPSPSCHAALAANFGRHAVLGKAFGFGLSDHPHRATLCHYPHVTAMTSLYADIGYDTGLTRMFLANSGFDATDIELMIAGRHVQQAIPCRLRTASEVIAEENIEIVDLIKINVEKAECDVLAGLSDRDWPKVRQVVVQMHDMAGRLATMRSDFERRGFTVTTDQDPLLAGTDIYEMFAIRTE